MKSLTEEAFSWFSYHILLLPSSSGSASSACLINVCVPQALASLYSYPWEISSHFVWQYMPTMPKPLSVAAQPLYTQLTFWISLHGISHIDLIFSNFKTEVNLYQRTTENHFVLIQYSDLNPEIWVLLCLFPLPSSSFSSSQIKSTTNQLLNISYCI